MTGTCQLRVPKAAEIKVCYKVRCNNKCKE